jgi:hypothetical protein
VTPRSVIGSLLALAAFSACKDGPGPGPLPGPPAMIAISSGNNQSAPANTVLQTPARVVVRDDAGLGVPNQQVTFAVVAGGGSIEGSEVVTTDANGVATAPAWRLGKSNVPQTLRATHGTWSTDIGATIQTNYDIVVRFFGKAMTAEDRALFTNAAARLEGIVTGDVIAANASNVEIAADSTCGITDEPPLNEIIDDVIIYAAIDSIDGPGDSSGNVLAVAGWCLGRPTTPGLMPAVGIMRFDENDLAALAGAGSLQDVITHEMLHVLGFGTLWEDRNLLLDGGSGNPRFTGPQGTAGCRAVGGTTSCAANVPVESGGGPGTAGGHWRESTFNTELMTGFIDSGALPISAMTIGSLADLGYVVNSADNDPYTIAIASLRVAGIGPVPAARRAGWERIHDTPKWILDSNGRARKLTRVK